jgi:hypothetical protein
MHLEAKTYPIDVTQRNVNVTLPTAGYLDPGCVVTPSGPRYLTWIYVADPGDTDPVPTRDMKFRLRQEGENLRMMNHIEYLGNFFWNGVVYVLGNYRPDTDPGGTGDIP